MTLFELAIIAALAGYRLSFMLNEEEGPRHVFRRFRMWLGVAYDGHDDGTATTWMGEAILCYFCLSVWVGIGLTIPVAVALIFNRLEIAGLLLLPFAISGVAIALRKFLG